MTADHLTYRRATSTSLFGLVVQTIVALTFLIYGLQTSDHASVSAAIFAGIGVLAWIALTVLFDQHRRERLEAMEAEALAEDDAGSVFAENEADLRVAARRLRFVRRILMPGAGLLIGGLLVGTGVARFASAQEIFPPGSFTRPTQPTVGLFVGIVIAVVGFIFARYAAGMAKRFEWSALRAGAGFAVGSSLIGLGLTIASFIQYAGPDTGQRVLLIAVPVLMILVGAEFFLNFLLDLYRPRKAGEPDRPAFDSRVLAFVAAPDRVAESISEAINYQLGFNVTGGWMYQLMSRSARWLIGFAAVVVWLLSCLVVIEPHQRAMILRFGEVQRADIGPGLHLKAPWPIDTVVIPEFVQTDARGRAVRTVRTATGIRRLELGTTRPRPGTDPILWTTDHAENETFTLTQPSSLRAVGRSGQSATDFGLVAIEVPLHYSIENVELYERLGPPGERDQLLEAVGRRAVLRYISGLTIDDVLAARRTEMASVLRERVEAAFAELNPGADGVARGAGVRVLFVGAEGVHPPKDTAEAFENVVSAQQNREGMILEAEARAIEILTEVVGSVELAGEVAEAIEAFNRLRRSDADPELITSKEQEVEQLLAEAGGVAAQRLAAARAARWRSHMAARSRAMEFLGQSVAFEAQPEVYRWRTYLSALGEALAGNRVMVVDSGPRLWVDLNLEQSAAMVDPFDPDAVPDP
ncbi:MAG: hypothetical protein EA378_09765 [Phycisphaerales bacterium]|nr:MAG: hypothetical protein EA378_09765 [Phycisphaerales bacterium]